MTEHCQSSLTCGLTDSRLVGAGPDLCIHDMVPLVMPVCVGGTTDQDAPDLPWLEPSIQMRIGSLVECKYCGDVVDSDVSPAH